MSEEIQQTETSETTVETNESETKEEKTFTQAELEEVIAKRLERERKKFADYDDLRTKAEQYEKELEEKRLADLSEKERAEELAKKYESEKQALAEQLVQIQEAAKQEKIRNAFILAAQGAGIAYIDDAFRLADLSAITVDDGGVVNGVDDVVKSLIEGKPFLLKQKMQPNPIGESTNSGDIGGKTAEQILAEAATKAKSTGKLEDQAAYAKLKRELSK